jgi:GSH-dependent disulfide-bond oxidoreductase
MLTFYRIANNSPNIRKVAMMLAETEMPHDVQIVERQDGKLADDYLAVNPNGTVPAIIDKQAQITLFESAAILCYLAEKSGMLLPDNPQDRGEVLNWLIFEAANIGPVVAEIYYYMMLMEDELADVHMQRYQDKLVRYCEIIDRRLERRDYLCEDFSIADIALFPWTAVFEDLADVDLADYPNLSAWMERISQRPSALV